jgi:Flp pilus assembly protein TadG
VKELRIKRRYHPGRDTRGEEVAEAAVVLPLLFMLVMAIYWFGQAFMIYGTLASAARAGARAAVTPVCATCGTAATGPAQNAQTAIQNTMTAAHLNSNLLEATGTWTAPTQCACHSGATSTSSCTSTSVPCDGTVSNVCVQENVQLSFPTEGAMGTCGTSVSMMYQNKGYKFSIPFTNLNLGNIQFPAQAQMRVETQ